jgi:uncharacterized membrane protein
MKFTDPDWLLIFAAVFPVATLSVIALLAPRLSRPDLFFAVTVDPSFRNCAEARGILRRYDGGVVIISLLTLISAIAIQMGSPRFAFGQVGPVFIELIGWLVVFNAARRRTRPYHVAATTLREAVAVRRKDSLPGGWQAQIIPFLIIGAAAAVLWQRWDNIPPRIATHFNSAGNPDHWSSKGFASVFGLLVIGSLVCGLIASLNWMIFRSTRRIHSSGNASMNEARFFGAIAIILLGVECWIALLFAGLSLLLLRRMPDAPINFLFPIMLGQTALIVAIVLLAFRGGQGGCRWAKSQPIAGDVLPTGDRTPDDCWKWGVFYYNPNDPALWVEKRFGLGWTLNLANVRSFMVLGAILLFIAASLGIGLFAAR